MREVSENEFKFFRHVLIHLPPDVPLMRRRPIQGPHEEAKVQRPAMLLRLEVDELQRSSSALRQLGLDPRGLLSSLYRQTRRFAPALMIIKAL